MNWKTVAGKQVAVLYLQISISFTILRMILPVEISMFWPNLIIQLSGRCFIKLTTNCHWELTEELVNSSWGKQFDYIEAKRLIAIIIIIINIVFWEWHLRESGGETPVLKLSEVWNHSFIAISPRVAISIYGFKIIFNYIDTRALSIKSLSV